MAAISWKNTYCVSIVKCPALADEGMWMPQQLPDIAKQLKAAGLKLNSERAHSADWVPDGSYRKFGRLFSIFVSPQGLVATNHHCVYNSIAYNSTPENDLLANGFLAKALSDEVAAAHSSRIYVTKAVDNVTDKIIDKATAKLTGQARINAIEANQKL